ncbi:c-type cytochrome [Aureibaculum sp. 2210JD6-5]|uniref:c-type cytochrome n=1 Tax=Aureibaculum sp. 2210JD6-5 TaxID=3103957 RepID=UPI002AAD804D|nr:c-type cytochrome [Aureibaculum sp. 2210JD6-5]MDY7395472.1 c-type cytochrome [Aureibaculum sp. 2210JD6-5]
MKKLSILYIAFAMLVVSCGDKKKEEVKKDVENVKEEVKETTSTGANDKDGQIAMGQKLFTDKTCTTCHALDTKVIGPSIKDMMKIYDEKGGNIVQFLKGNADPIVDTDPGQVAIMQANIDGFVKDMTPEELQAVAAYMRDAAK